MLNYTVKVEGYDEDEKNIYFKLRITDLNQMEARELKARYSTLSDMHIQLMNDNMNHDFPPFPKKDTWKSMYKYVVGQDNQDQIKSRESALNTYFYQLLKFPPHRIEALTSFLRDGVDAIRQQSLATLNNKFTSKKEFFKQYQRLKTIEKSFFKNIYLVQQNFSNYQFKQFRLPSNEHQTRYLQVFQDGHAKLTDFTYITQVKNIFELRSSGGLMRMIWGNKKQQKNKKSNLFSKMGYIFDESDPYEYIYSLEEDLGQSLQEEYIKRCKNKAYFQFDEILLIMQSLVSGCHYLHKNGFTHKNIQLKNIFLQLNGSVKLSGALEPSIEFKERYQLTQNNSSDERIYIPPESINQISNNYAYSQYSGSSYYNVHKVDSWAIGICLIQLCTLKPTKDILDIHSSSLHNLHKQIMDIYGGGLSSIISLMTARNPKDRSDITELIQQVYQTHLIPMRLDLFSLPQNSQPKTIKYKISTLDEVSLKKFNMSIKENQKNPLLVYDLTFNFVSQGKFEENSSILFDQIKIIKLRSLQLNFEGHDFLTSSTQILTFTQLLLQTTQVPFLTLNLRDCVIQQEQIQELIKAVVDTQVKQFILDISGVANVSVCDLKTIMDGQSWSYKIYCVGVNHEKQLNELNIIQEI